MKAVFENWLRIRSSPREALAAGICFNDRSCITRTFSPDFAPQGLESLLQGMTDTVQSLSQPRMLTGRVKRMCWAFEKARVFWATRSDGACLAIITTSKADAATLAATEGWLIEFENLSV